MCCFIIINKHIKIRMVNETKVNYIYYTVIDTRQWVRGNEDIFGDDGFTWEKAIEFVNYKFRESKDNTVNNCIVDYAQYVDDIEEWKCFYTDRQICPVFVKFQKDQEIKITDEGELFALISLPPRPVDEEEEDDNAIEIYNEP